MRSIKRHFSHFLKDATLTLILLAVAMPSLAQSGDQGSISGVVFDSSGAVVADARVKIRNVSTSFAVSTTTIDSGLFFFPILPVGLYELTADHAGFATIQLNNIDLTVGANLTLTLRFSVAGGKEAIAVMDETPILEKSRSQLSNTILTRWF